MLVSLRCIPTFRLINRFSPLLNFTGFKTQSITQSNDIFDICNSIKQPNREFHTSFKRADLMEFFDDAKNWGVQDVKTGRPWNKEELRIKSNADLHKLWYVLYKEKNMLLTMEEVCKRECELFPAPERIDKVEESMKHLLEVIEERDRAVHLLETGETGERPGYWAHSPLGNQYYYIMREWPIPWYMNRKWTRRYFWYTEKEAIKFQCLVREKAALRKMNAQFRQKEYEQEILKRFPNADLSAIEPFK